MVPNADVLVQDQFVEHVNDSALCRELKRLVRSTPTLSMLQVRTEAIRWEQEGRPHDNSRGQCPKVAVRLGGVVVDCLLDTGSMVSTITESFFQQHLQGKLRSCRWLQLRAANGLEIPYVGYVELLVEVLGKLFPDRGWLVVKDPPGSAGSVAVPGVLGMNVIHGLLISTSLVRVARGTVYVPVVNVGQARVGLHPCCPLGLLSQAQVVSLPAGVTEVVSEVPTVVALAQAQVAQVSPILEQIEGLDLSSLSSEEQMRVKSLLQKYASAFSAFEGDLGCTGLLSHDIPLFDDAPMRQHYRRIPPSDYDAVKAHIRQLLVSRVIRESCSPYASPIVLVKKKNEKPLHVC
ncbi:hypothetical protein SRHO_G00048360 [Serrasalmus rhombeus]